ncbi:MAG: cobyric acid synthase [Clostridia bacterium]|nr:cobyric acid synthase [Clostridia bacterium]
MTKSIMFQGTGSHVGKSVLVAAICRILKQDGLAVAPFKSQNMALNSYVTQDGGEMGRAQVVQAEAAGLEPDVDMNPILLKPTGQASSQVIVLGKPIGNLSARRYHTEWTKEALGIIQGSWDRLCSKYEAIVIEGAGSPAEVNLKETEIVNMRIAKMTKSPVILIGDIDKGGVLASLVGTLELLEPEERDLVAGFVINKFRGDVSLFQPAIDFLEAKTGKPVLGVVPYFQGFRVQEEDSIPEEGGRPGLERDMEKVDVAVIRLPHISNFTDFDALQDEPDVQLRYVQKGQKIGKPDLIIIPGSKNTIEDMVYLEKNGFAREIKQLADGGTPVIGICGGFQILGTELHDPKGTESSIPSVKGLSLLDMVTVFEPDKITCQVTGEVIGEGIFLSQVNGQPVTGYEIHMGRTQLLADTRPAFRLTSRSTKEVDVLDGGVSANGQVFGTYLHGIFDNDGLRRHIINTLRLKKGLLPMEEVDGISVKEQREKDFDKLAQVVRDSLNMNLLYEIMGVR